VAEYLSWEETARRFYHADGSSELLDSATEVIARRVEAARELERLRAEVARLTGLVYAYPPVGPFAPDGHTWKQEAARLGELVARLRPIAEAASDPVLVDWLRDDAMGFVGKPLRGPILNLLSALDATGKAVGR
jgi:hypothetical protein